MFVDEVEIEVSSGNGGRGCVSFLRERFMPKGGPDGGDGGRGGDVILRVKQGLNTLHAYRFQREYRAKNGLPGEGSKKKGKDGADLFLDVPPGTLVRDVETGELVVDFCQEVETWTVLEGGKGGRGNFHFRSSVNQRPQQSEKGLPGGQLKLYLSLKLIADVGLVGLPNAGKSSLLARLTNARPKVADYPFTTLQPLLGTHVYDNTRQVVFADIPGLIEGASEGRGMGNDFLKHVERTRLLIHLVEPESDDRVPLPERVRMIEGELENAGQNLAGKPRVLVMSKLDLGPHPEEIAEWEQELGAPLVQISSATGEGMDDLHRAVVGALEELDAEEAAD